MDDTKTPVQIDVEKVLFSKNPRLKKVLPRFVINYLKRIVHQDDINEIIRTNGHLRGSEFNDAVLEGMGIKYSAFGVERLSPSGRYLFVSNHPLGGLDGMVFMSELSKHYNSIKFPVNDILLYLENYSDIFLPVNKHGTLGRQAALLIEEAYNSDCQMLNFPAGICSRRIKGSITDLEWQKSFIVKAIQHKRDVVPCYFSGRNSSFFYNLARLRSMIGVKANLEMLYLADEMFRQKGKEIRVVFGDPIPWTYFDKTRTPREWAEWVREKSYKLKEEIPGR